MLREEISNLNREHEREMRKMIVVQQRQRKEIEEQRVAADVRGVRERISFSFNYSSYHSNTGTETSFESSDADREAGEGCVGNCDVELA